MTPTLFVHNVEQAACMLELDGQISDGYWENARPASHWKVWCEAAVVVAPEGHPVGRNFHAAKTSYNFTAPDLLDVVGKRMLAIVRIARALGIEVAAVLEHAPDCKTGTIDWSASWMDKRKEQLSALGATTEAVDAALADESYAMRDLVRDLRDLKQIIRERVQ